MRKPNGARGFPGKIVAAVLVLACVAIGVVGIVLPVIPGLLFLAIAALIAARNVPWVEARLRAHRSFGPRMHRIDRFFGLSLLDQLRVVALIGAKGVLDTLDRIGEWVSKRADGSGARSP